MIKFKLTNLKTCLNYSVNLIRCLFVYSFKNNRIMRIFVLFADHHYSPFSNSLKSASEILQKILKNKSITIQSKNEVGHARINFCVGYNMLSYKRQYTWGIGIYIKLAYKKSFESACWIIFINHPCNFVDWWLQNHSICAFGRDKLWIFLYL